MKTNSLAIKNISDILSRKRCDWRKVGHHSEAPPLANLSADWPDAWALQTIWEVRVFFHLRSLPQDISQM